MKKKVVAYFSASGVTRHVSEKLAKEIGADLYEIQPEELYSQEDLDWRNKDSRSSLEMRDKSSRPALKAKDFPFEEYQEIHIGFPIWWGVAPHIVNSFLEAYDFSGKEIYPFATSGGSGFGKSKEELLPSAKGAVWHEGRLAFKGGW